MLGCHFFSGSSFASGFDLSSVSALSSSSIRQVMLPVVPVPGVVPGTVVRRFPARTSLSVFASAINWASSAASLAKNLNKPLPAGESSPLFETSKATASNCALNCLSDRNFSMISMKLRPPNGSLLIIHLRKIFVPVDYISRKHRPQPASNQEYDAAYIRDENSWR